ncbi:MAG: hypothetical protein US54_C0040G0002 [Candidatus Roizmanbacteria bacterium GW2011_GWA2_37_7]|uniref:Radical SAM domain protein n=1 Tax=Candidatus Roizmanbacteria bacterium GW2011_GWA2_37_7 TaxID=1618481 RepID=A0A0G0K9G2_9BACT|nr:MAG: hypothetical protein US54_C0040G0002 [Candidatus Roizmanbacteria bacterium GW2011_GWA2_37_7]
MKEGEDAGSASIPRAYARGFESAVKLARAYIRQKYPLTGRGMELQNQTKDALCQNDLARLDQFAQYCLPTVEEPKLELFEPLNIPKEFESLVFGHDLNTIQSHQGCTWQCTHCAFSTPNKIETMPYSAVLQIGQKKALFEDALRERMGNWLYTVHVRNEISNYNMYNPTQNDIDRMKAGGAAILFFNDPLSKLLPPDTFKMGFPVEKSDFELDPVSTYYDSEPLEYMDPNFLHKDGRPANFGDVWKALATTSRTVYITTAGWRSGNMNAIDSIGTLIDMKKILGAPSIIFRLSVNQFHPIARKSYSSYILFLQRIYDTIKSLGPQFSIIVPKDDMYDEYFVQNVVGPFQKYVEESEADDYDRVSLKVMGRLSRRHGRMADGRHQEDNDVDNSAGFLIRPTGQIKFRPFSDNSAFIFNKQVRKPKPESSFETMPNIPPLFTLS